MPKDGIKITADELAKVLVERADNLDVTSTPKQKDILIFSSCFNSNFIRKVYDLMGDRPKPIALGSAEYGQYGYMSPDSKFGSLFFGNVLDLQNGGQKSTLSTVYDNETKDARLNPTVYIPDEDNKAMQIVKDRQKRRGDGGVNA
jgi:hypothetical protein